MTAAHIGSTLLHRSDDQSADPTHRVIAELLARIGLHLGCQRVELYGATRVGSRLIGWWGTLGHEAGPDPDAAEPAPGWFPWSLGNLRPSHHLFVENAEALRSSPGGPTLGSMGFGSALYLPISDPSDGPAGASVCAYWTRTGPHWAPDTVESIQDWVVTSLSMN